MKKTTLVFVLLLTTITLWLIALTTPGWFVLSANRLEYGGFRERYSFTIVVQGSVFYLRVCIDRECTYRSYYELNEYEENGFGNIRAFGFEFQVDTLLAFVLYGISCILVMLPDSCSCNKKCILSVVTIILAIAETTALLMIFRMCVVNYASMRSTSGRYFIHFPYSLIFAGLSLVVGIIALVFNYVALRSLINRDAANYQYFGLTAGDQHVYNQVLEDNLRRPNEANEDLSQETNNMAANYQYLELSPEEQHVENQVPQDNLRRPNEANEDLSHETNNMAATYQYLELSPEDQHVENQVSQDNLRRPNEANEDLPQETNKMA